MPTGSARVARQRPRLGCESPSLRRHAGSGRLV